MRNRQDANLPQRPIGYNPGMRFRPQFSLRILFAIVSLSGVLMGWTVYQKNWIGEMHQALAAPNTACMLAGTGRTAPWSLRLFGERGAASVNLLIIDADRTHDDEDNVTINDPRLTPAERQEMTRLARLFPEADIGAWFRRTPPPNLVPYPLP